MEVKSFIYQQSGIFITQRWLNSMLLAPFFVLQDWRFFQHDPRTYLLPRKQSLISWWAEKVMKLFSTHLLISNLCAAVNNTIYICANKHKQLHIWIDLNETAITFPAVTSEIPNDIDQTATEILLPAQQNKTWVSHWIVLTQGSLSENTKNSTQIKLQGIQL